MTKLKNGDGIVWPDGRRIALMITFDYDVEFLRQSRNPGRPLGFADRSRGEYGPCEGLRRCLDVMDRQGVKGTFFVPGQIAQEYEEDIRRIDQAGHELAYHGWDHNTSLHLSREEEEKNMERAEEVIRRLTGKTMVGSRGCSNITYDYTPDLLRKRGYLYSSVRKDCDWAYLYEGEKGAAPLVELPTEHTFDDYTYFFFSFDTPCHRANYPIDYVFSMWKDAFDELADEGDKVFVLKLHPQLIGRSSRAILLERFIQYAKEQGAWVAPCREVAEHVAGHTPSRNEEDA